MIIHDEPEQTVLVGVFDQGPTTVRIAVGGDLDLHGVETLSVVLDQLPATMAVELDLGGVEFMDCSGLRAVVCCREQRPTTVVNASSAVRRICELTSLQHVLDQS